MRGPLCLPRVDRRSRDGCGGDPKRRRTGYVYAAPAGGSLPPRGRWIAAGETDEGKVRKRSGRLIPTCPVRQVPGRCGHRPLREGRDFSLNRARRMFQRSAPHPSGPLALPPSPEGKATYRRGTLYFSPPWTCRCPLHTQPCGGTLSKQERAGVRKAQRAGVPPHTRQGLWPCHPLPGEGRGRRRLRAFPRFLPPFLCRPRSHG